MRNRKSALLLLGTLLCLAASSQSFVGYGYDNYSGVNGVLLNPGMLADSKYKVNVNLLSVSGFAGNNAYEMDRSKVFGFKFSNLSEGNGYYKTTNTDYKYMYLNTDILGPSAMFNLNSKNALGIITRMRVIANEYNLGNPLFQLFGNNPNINYYNLDIINRSLQTKMQAFAEAGLSYGRVLSRDEHHEFKIGLTGKYIAGLAYGGISSGQMTVNIDPLNNIAKLIADVTAQYSANLDNLGNGTKITDAFNKKNGQGWGADFGFVYETKQAGETRLRFGMSITDLGSVKYTKSTNSQTYTMTADGHNTQELAKQDSETYAGYINRLETNGLIVAKSTPANMSVKLPTALHINVDYRVYRRLFIDADVLINTVAASNPVTPNYITTFTVTPRLEKKWFSIYSPVSYNAQGQLSWGAGFRLGPLFAGSGTLVSSMLRNRLQAVDFHAGLNIPIFQNNNKKDKKDKNSKSDTLYRKILITHDRDSDGVVDDRDACPDSAGPIALIGCPDSDGDGVPNIKDKCPGVKGSPNFQGCPAPDTDGDGVNDDDDKCPLVKGLASNHGCPPIKPEILQRMQRAADRIFFVRAKATIEKNCYTELDRVLEILQSDSTLHLHIEGHTDSEGTDQRNDALSKRRAKAVMHWLVSKGIPASRMDTEAYGSKRPLADNSTPEGMAQNRRVEMELTNWKH